MEQLTERADERVSLIALAADALPESQRGRLIVAAVALAVGLLSFFVIGAWASSPSAYTGIIASLDAKRSTVMGLVGGSTGVSGAITLLPGDVGTPIAEKLLDVGADFGIVLGAIYLEKYLLTILGFVAFKVLVPLACVLVAASALLYGQGLRFRELFLSAAARLALFGVVAALVVPVSVLASDAIDATYQESMAQTLAAAENASSAAEGAAQDDEGSTSGEDAEPSGFLELIQSIPESISSGAASATEEAQEALNNFIETLAVMIVTSCVIPVLVLVFFLWLAKTILGLDTGASLALFKPRALRGRH